MAIQGLRSAPQPMEASISDQVGASVEALNMLGLVQDRDQVTESVAAEFRNLEEIGQTGERYIQLPRGIITLQELVTVADSATYPGDKKYPGTYVYSTLWTPGANPHGYKTSDLDNLTLGQANANWPAHARSAVHNPASEQEPLLHFLGQPYDELYAETGQQTQLEAIAEAAQANEAAHEGFAMTPLNAKAVAMIALTRRIKGESMPLSWGYMRDATLPRKTVDGDSYVGYVNSLGVQLSLSGSLGHASSDSGVGLSVGPKELELQAS